MPRRIALWVDIAVKATLIGLLLLAVVRLDLPQFAYEDTLGDLAHGLTGSLVAALVTAGLWTHLRSPVEEFPRGA